MSAAHPLSLASMREPLLLELSEVKARAARIVSDRTGIVSAVEIVQTGPCDPLVYWASASHSDSTPIFGARALNDGNACAADPDLAVVKALGESIERYCAAGVDPDALELEAFRALDRPAVPPSDWALFSEAQYADPDFPVAKFDEDSRIRWISGHSLTNDRAILVPAAFTYIPYVPAPGESRIIPWQASTGLASHTSLPQAALRALLEVVERDAFMLSWQRQIACPELDVANLESPALRELVDRTEVLGYERSIRVLTLDLPLPVILVVLRSDAHKPYVAMGCSADCVPERALRLALEEALLSLHGITILTEREPVYRPEAPGYGDVRDLLKHAWIYAVDPELRPVMSRQLRPSGRVTLGDLPRGPEGSPLAQLRWLVSALAARDLEAVVVDLTTSDIDDVGFKVVRGLVPGMQPLDVDHRYRHLGGSRLYATADALGVSPERISDVINEHPQPFP